jgi:hypothetical protein
MSIIQEVTEKKFLTEEEKTILKDIQTKSQSLILELGEISMVKIQIESKYEITKSLLIELSDQEKEFTKNLFDKYGSFNLDPKTSEIIKVD